MPRFVEFRRESLPKSTVGKILRRAIAIWTSSAPALPGPERA
uniref:AMP-binding enzyme C-terminal domain-containing protein n=1 Tax=Ralstonia solanacearum TaxID=305 RepID=A0A0S4TRW4_RALSL|nr:protein of unknown function [Ralstonia solanacearum]